MALIDDGGRYKTVRTPEEEAKIIADSFDSLSEEEKALAISVLNELGTFGTSALFPDIQKTLYRVQPVSMEVFVNDPFYLGDFSKTLFPSVKRTLIEAFSGGYHFLFLGGALGGGKTSTGIAGMIRMVYELSCLRDPQTSYGISKPDSIIIPGVSVTEDLAERNIIEKIRNIISDSEYFNKYYRPIKNTATHGIIFPFRVIIPPGTSTESGALGGNAIGAFIDESNFFNNNKSKSSHGLDTRKSNIERIYEAIKRRIESRFMSRGKLPGMIIVASSKTHNESFTEKEIRAIGHRSDVYVVEKSVWEVHPEGRYGGETFRVAIGNETQLSRILAAGEPDPEGVKVIDVPIEFYDSFEKDPDLAIRDLAGYSTVAITPFIARREKIYEAIDTSMVHPFSVEVWEMGYPAQVEWDKITVKRKDGAYEPKINPLAPRHIHIDLSKNQDSTGFCVSHIGGYLPIRRAGNPEPEYAPVIVNDFMLKMRAPRSGEIIYSEIRNLIYEFSRHGFYIKLLSADQFQSSALLQTMASQGYSTKIVSVEVPGGPYESLKLALYENRVKYYNYAPLINELKYLQKNWKTGKVDHTETSEKDLSDALASNVATLTAASSGYMPTHLYQNNDEIIVTNDESWVLDNPKTIVVSDGTIVKRPGPGPDRDFVLPFEVG